LTLFAGVHNVQKSLSQTGDNDQKLRLYEMHQSKAFKKNGIEREQGWELEMGL
jgi:hypothetical protein